LLLALLVNRRFANAARDWAYMAGHVVNVFLVPLCIASAWRRFQIFSVKYKSLAAGGTVEEMNAQNRRALTSLKGFVKDGGRCVVLYPEGGRGEGSLKQGEAKTTAIFEIVLKASPYGLMVLPSYVDGATSILPVARGEDEFSEFLLHIRRGNGTITFGRPVEYQYIRPTEDEVARAAPHCGDCDPRKRVTIDRVMRLIAELCPSEGGRGPYRFV